LLALLLQQGRAARKAAPATSQSARRTWLQQEGHRVPVCLWTGRRRLLMQQLQQLRLLPRAAIVVIRGTTGHTTTIIVVAVFAARARLI
jgi:hypothetical protein